MSRHSHRTIWRLLALLMLAQSMLPTVALARVDMRCVSPLFSLPCRTRVVPTDGESRVAARIADMPCCQGAMAACHMMPHNALASAQRTGPLGARSMIAAPKCAITVRQLNNAVLAIAPQDSQWLLNYASAFAPSLGSLLILGQRICVAVVYPSSVNMLHGRHDHGAPGLRAPPRS